MEKIQIQYFSDVLCVWAYVAQARLDELQLNHGDKIEVSYHFIPVYGNTQKRVVEGWRERGGIPAYIKFIKGVANDFGHVKISEKFWTESCQPNSSALAHLFLKAVNHLIATGVIENKKITNEQGDQKTLFEELVWQFRYHYFAEGLNLGLLENQLSLAESLGLPTEAIIAAIHDGSAMALMCQDYDLKEKFNIEGSPTYLMNEGRQKLYGNVGYKIIAANLEELLNRPGKDLVSWC